MGEGVCYLIQHLLYLEDIWQFFKSISGMAV